MLPVSHSEAAKQIFSSFNNLSETDAIHVPLILSSCGLKAVIFMGCCLYMSADERRSRQQSTEPQGSEAGSQPESEQSEDLFSIRGRNLTQKFDMATSGIHTQTILMYCSFI